jgi:hypothetical protein
MGPTPAELVWIRANQDLTMQLFGTLTPQAGAVTEFVYQWYDQQGDYAPAPDAVDSRILLDAYRNLRSRPIPPGQSSTSTTGGDCCCEDQPSGGNQGTPSIPSVINQPAINTNPWAGGSSPGIDGVPVTTLPPISLPTTNSRFSRGGRILLKEDPWAAAIDGKYRVPPAFSLSQLMLGENLTQTPEYAAANPPPYQP